MSCQTIHLFFMVFDQWFKVFIYSIYIFLFIERGKSLSLIQLIAIFVAISSCLLEKPVVMDLAVPLFDIKIEKVFAILCTFQPSLRDDASGQKVFGAELIEATL